MSQRVAVQLKEQFLLFIDDLIEICPSETSLAFMRLYVSNSAKPSTIADNMVRFVLPHALQISRRESKYFEENRSIFGTEVPDSVHEKFKNLWCNVLEEEDKEIVWDYFDVFVGLAKKCAN